MKGDTLYSQLSVVGRIKLPCVPLTVKASTLFGKVQKIPEGFHGGHKDKHARVETVRPANIRSG